MSPGEMTIIEHFHFRRVFKNKEFFGQKMNIFIFVLRYLVAAGHVLRWHVSGHTGRAPRTAKVDAP